MSTDTNTESEEWERLGRELLSRELGKQRMEVNGLLHEAVDSLRQLDEEGEKYSGELTAEEVVELRRSLNCLRRLVENHAARVTDGVEPWGDQLPDMPYGAYPEVVVE